MSEIEVLISIGQYSDYTILGLYKVPSREWLDAEWQKFLAEWLPKIDEDEPDEQNHYPAIHDFVTWIEARGAKAMEQAEVHLDRYPKQGEKLEWSDV